MRETKVPLGDNQMTKQFPKQVLATADGWGDEYHFDRAGMEKNIVELKKLGDEWENISIDECDSYELISAHGSKAVYQQEGIRDESFAVFSHSDIEGFDYVGHHNNLEDAIEEATE